jgi:hypothetical protein
MTRQRIRQVEQANLHPVDGRLGVFGQVGQLLPRDALAAKEGLLVEPAQHLLLQRPAAFASAPSSLRESPSNDIAGFSCTTRVFQTQAPPRAPKRRTAPGAAAVSSVVATTPAQYPALVRHRCGCTRPRRTS